MNGLVCFATLLALRAAVGLDFDYFDQEAWGDLSGSVCTMGMRQSPIRINSRNVRWGRNLFDLLPLNWDMEREGILENNSGHTVKFIPETGPVAVTATHQGVYILEQCHFHWGGRNYMGSEHIVDGQPDSAEIHFVHRRSEGPLDAGNSIAVIAVRARAFSNDDDDDDDFECEEDSSVWDQLNILAVRKFESKTKAIVNFHDFLPADLSYYYYEGSLTTPPCSEIVQWFVLKETINIPNCILKRFRMVERDSEGALLTFNHRTPQNLNGRMVMEHRPNYYIIGS